MTDPAIIEAAARALHNECYTYLDDEEAQRLANHVLAAVTPLILEQAAKVVEDHMRRELVDCSEVAAAIRALKLETQPPPD